HKAGFLAAAFSPDGKTVVTGTPDGGRLWDVSTGQPIGPPLQPGKYVGVVAFSPDGRIALTASNAGAGVRLWETATGKPAGQPMPQDVNFSCFSADGQHIFTGS